MSLEAKANDNEYKDVRVNIGWLPCKYKTKF